MSELCEHTFVREYRFTTTQYDSDRPWIVVSTERRTVKLEDDEKFYAWADREWPRPRFKVELDPWQLSPPGLSSRT
jgi:hypothetical protein